MTENVITFRGVRRTYKITGLSDRGTLLILKHGTEPRDTNETATAWVGDANALKADGVFHYYTDEEQKILRRGLLLDQRAGR